MNEPSTVTYPTAEILSRIEDKIDSNQKETFEKFKELSQKIDKQSEKIGAIEVKLTAVETEVRNFKEDVRDIKTVQNTLVQEVSDLKGVKSLIIPIVVAVATALLTLLFRLVPNIPH
ncbi:MAG: shikimate dehydrogenase [Crocosphaera sp.]|nr:shikimate dehydrogenase [Crocosphaera sp.]